MSYTNHTTNYNLPQYVGTDKPTYLGDFNSAMSAIDTQMKLNADSASTAGTNATTANTNIGTLANLETTAKTNLVSAINEVNTAVGTAQNTANSASSSASIANLNIAKFNLTERSTLSPNTNKGTIDSSVTNVQFATDTTSSVFKIYGRAYIKNLSGQSGTLTVTLGQTSLRPATSYSINTGALVNRLFDSGHTDTVPRNITINTDGSIVLSDTLPTGLNVVEYSIMLPPCLYFNSDFGDE